MTLAKTLLRPLGRAERLGAELDSRFEMGEARAIDVATGVTCVLILLTGPKEWYVSVFASALAAAALIFPKLRAQTPLWAFLGTAVGASAFVNWESTDNHKYLLAYWCVGVMLSLAATDQRDFLAKCARSLIGASFALAVLWKLRTPDFVVGDFFRLQLVLDKRFVAVASWAGGLTVEELQALRAAWSSLEGIELSARLNIVAIVMTVWTLLIEIWVAVAYLAPQRTLLGRFRDVPLLGFALSTYAVATVLGFGYLLLAMGLCQARSQRARLAYVAAFILMFLFEIPVFALSQGALGADAPRTFLGTNSAEQLFPHQDASQ
jgi:hypothetical protein